MKIELHNTNDIHGKAIKLFLTKNNLKFHEIMIENIKLLNSIVQIHLKEKMSILKVKYSHSIHVQRGFNEHFLNQILEHIKKYNPKII